MSEARPAGVFAVSRAHPSSAGSRRPSPSAGAITSSTQRACTLADSAAMLVCSSCTTDTGTNWAGSGAPAVRRLVQAAVTASAEASAESCSAVQAAVATAARDCRDCSGPRAVSAAVAASSVVVSGRPRAASTALSKGFTEGSCSDGRKAAVAAAMRETGCIPWMPGSFVSAPIKTSRTVPSVLEYANTGLK